MQRQRIASPEILSRAIALGFTCTSTVEPITLTEIQYWLRESEHHVETTYMKRMQVYWSFNLGCTPAMVSTDGHSTEFPTHDDALEAGIIRQLERLERAIPKAYVIGRDVDGETKYLMQDETTRRRFTSIEEGCEFLRSNGSTLTNEEMQEKFKFEPTI